MFVRHLAAVNGHSRVRLDCPLRAMFSKRSETFNRAAASASCNTANPWSASWRRRKKSASLTLW